MDYVFISGVVRALPFYMYQWGGMWAGETHVFELIDKVCVSSFLFENKHFCSAVQYTLGHNIVNKQMESRGAGRGECKLHKPPRRSQRKHNFPLVGCFNWLL